jgi:hypothetical protein
VGKKVRKSGVKTGALALALAPIVLGAALAPAEVTQKGDLRVAFEGKISPRALPRAGTAPVEVTLSGQIATTDQSPPPQLRKIALAINRNGRLDHRGLPACRYHQIQPASTREALAACRRSLVGSGRFKAKVLLPEQSPFPSNGKILAFNGTLHGAAVLYAHIYGVEPLPTSFTLPFAIKRTRGTYRTTLISRLPRVAAQWGFIDGIDLTLGRRFRRRGRTHSYLSAGCPAPAGFPGAVFPFARASFGFEDGRTLASTLNRSCVVR